MKWTFEAQTPQRPSGENMAEPNFSKENKNLVRLFVREFFQNTIDARSDDSKVPGTKIRAHVRVRLLDQNSGLDTNYIRQITKGLNPHLIASGHIVDAPDWSKTKVLILEEYHTKGLTGITNNSYAKGEDERWANFWFGESRRSKTGASLGRAGQGKITYHISSGIRSIFALTRRENDTIEYLFGKCIVRETHEIDGEHFTHHGYWPKIDEEKKGQPIPETDKAKVKLFKEAFKLERDEQLGTSWIIPLIAEQITEPQILREFLGDFFFSVLTEGVTLEINGIIINSSTIQEIFKAQSFDDPSNEFFEFLVDCVTAPPIQITAKSGWEEGDKIPEESFNEGDLDVLRKDIKEGKIVSVNLPIEIHLKNGTKKASFISLSIQVSENIKRLEELYIRSGLVIAEEKYLVTVAGSGFGLMMATDLPISEFLGYCEVASHLKWNAKEQPAIEKYLNVAATLSTVRRSLPRLHRLLVGESEGVYEDALDDILSLAMPKSEKALKVVKPRLRTPPKTPAPPKPPKPPELEIFKQESNKAGEWRLVPGKDAVKATYPYIVTFTFAYDRIKGSGNPWNMWHPFDFDLADKAFVPVRILSANISRNGQILDVELLSSKFNVSIGGFSKVQRLLVKGD